MMSTIPPRKRSRRWIWYFVLLAVLTVAATVILAVYNLRQQLTSEQLAAARKLWEEKRPANYVLTYTKKGNASGTFVVTVRHGKVQSATMREEVPGEKQVKVVELPARLYRNYDMAGLFDDLERFLDLATKKDSPRTFMRANFDANNGQVRRFFRSVQSTREWVEIDVEAIDTSGS